MSDHFAVPPQAETYGSDPSAEPQLTDQAQYAELPPVVAVVVASDPGDYFAETLASLANQNYDNLSVLVIDSGSKEPIADRVAEVIPDAYLHRLTGEPGWSVAANQSLELVSGSPFLLFCHDDVALDPDCVRILMEAIYEHNGGIAGPKLVDWDDDRKMLQLGMTSDRFGAMVEHIERGEFDQEQYDEIRSVFVVPGGVQLVRADLFTALGGFDPSIALIGEDLDLCWRAHALGARALIVSTAHARHLESMDSRLPTRDQHKLATRHRLRTMIVTSTGRSRHLWVPIAFLLICLEAFYYLMSGRRGQARDTISTIWWNLSRLGDIRRRRRAIRQMRTVDEKAIRSIQSGGSAVLNNFSRGQFTAGQDKFSGLFGAIRASFAGEDSGSLRDATVIGFLITLILTFGSRHMLTRGVPAVGQMPVVPSAAALLEEWWGGWRSTGTGGPGNAPSAFILLAAGRQVIFWSESLFTRLIHIGPLFVGVISAYRLLRPLGSARTAAMAVLLYATSPLVSSAYSAGRWDSMVVYGAAPMLIGSLLRLSGLSPFGTVGGEPGLRVVPRSLPVLVVRYGILVALVASFVPSIVVVAVLMAAGFAIGSPFLGRQASPIPYLLAAGSAIAAPIALHGPWSYDIVNGFTWSWFVGSQSPEYDIDGMADIVLFTPGWVHVGWASAGLLMAAVGSLAVARPRYFGMVVQVWATALMMFVLLWLQHRGWLGIPLPAAETLLAVALACLVFAVGVGIRSIEIGELPVIISRIGRLGAGLALTVAVLGSVILTFDGQWHSPTGNYAAYTSILDNDDEVSELRTLWIGDASVLPSDVDVTSSGIQYAVTDGRVPELWGRWKAGSVGRTEGVGQQLDLAAAGETVRLGRLLAPYGIKLVVVVDQLAPAPYGGPKVSPGDGVLATLTQQLDLERVPGIPNLVVFNNASASGLSSLLPSPEAAEAVTAADQLEVDLGAGSEVPSQAIGSGKWLVEAPGTRPIMLSVPNVGLSVNGVKGQTLSGFDDMTVLPSALAGELEIEYTTPLGRRLGVLGQTLVVAAGVIIAQTRREDRA